MGLDSVELVMAYEHEFGIKIDNAAAQKMITPRHVIDFIERNLTDKPERPARAQIAAVVKQITIKQLSLPESEYGEDKEFIRDFGID